MITIDEPTDSEEILPDQQKAEYIIARKLFRKSDKIIGCYRCGCIPKKTVTFCFSDGARGDAINTHFSCPNCTNDTTLFRVISKPLTEGAANSLVDRAIANWNAYNKKKKESFEKYCNSKEE